MQAQTLAGHAIKAALLRACVEGPEVDDVVLGAALQQGCTQMNVARQAAVRAQLPATVPAMTLDRQCASGLMAIATAANQIKSEGMNIAVAGGVESVSLVQNQHMNTYRSKDEWLVQNAPSIYMSMIETAEVVSDRYGVPRLTQDEYSVISHKRAEGARQAGLFEDEIKPIDIEQRAGDVAGPADAPRQR